MSRIVVKSGLPFTVAPKSLCILRLSAIGDVCHTLAVVRAIQDQWPETRLTWIIGKLEHSLIGDIADIEFLVYDKGQEKQSLKQLKQQLAGREFDALLHMQISMRSSRISRLISSPIKLGYDKARAKDFQWLFTNQRIAAVSQQHVMDALFGFAEGIGVPRPPNPQLRWDIPLTEAQQAFAQQQNPQNKPTLVISPCSSQRARNFRNWSVENYIAAAKHAEQLGMVVIVTGGPSELEKQYGDAIAEATNATNLVAKTNLKELLALLRQASGLLSPDSGPAHMATTVGTAVIGLYATSNPARTGPYLSNERWVVNAYPKACQHYLGKSVSEMKWGQRVRHPEAMDLIELDAVCEQITRLAEQA